MNVESLGNEKFARVETLNISASGRLLIIGDIHGCLNELQMLLHKASFQEGRDQIIVVGDFVNKGPDSIGVVRLMQRLGAKGVQGNHDLKMLKLVEELRSGGKKQKKDKSSPKHTLAATLPSDVEQYLSSLPHILRIPLYNLIIVHAGLHPKRPLEQQTIKDVTEMRNLLPTADGFISSSEKTEGVAWASLWPGPETVIFGHDAGRGLQQHPHAMGIDSRCVKGGSLTAVVYPGAQLVSVPGWTGDAKV